MKAKFKYLLQESRLQLSIFLVVLVMFVIFIIFNPATFLSRNMYLALMSIIPFTAILAISITLLVIVGEIDLSFPSVIGIGSYTYAFVFTNSGNVYFAFICSLLIGAFAGLINYVFVVKVGIPSLIITLGMSFVLRGLVNVLMKGLGISLVETKEYILYKIFIGRIGGIIPAQVVWLVVIAISFSVILNLHRFGTHILFTGDNIQSAKMMGINVNRVKLIIFVQLGIFSSVVGMLSSSEILYVYPSAGEGYLLRVLAAVFIGSTSIFGGSGTIFGTLMGSIIIGSLEAGILAMGVSGFWVQLVYGLVIVSALNFYAYLTKLGKH